MNWRLGRHRMQERDVVDMLGKMGKQIAHPLATLAVLAEFPARFDDAARVLVTAATMRLHGDRLAIHADHRRLVVEGVDVARTAIHEQENDALGLWRQSVLAAGRADWLIVSQPLH